MFSYMLIADMKENLFGALTLYRQKQGDKERERERERE